MPTKTQPVSTVVSSLIEATTAGRIFKYEDLPELTAEQASEFFKLTQCDPAMWPKAAWPDAMLRAMEIVMLRVAGFRDIPCPDEPAVFKENGWDRSALPKNLPMIRTAWGFMELVTYNQGGSRPGEETDNNPKSASIGVDIQATKSWADNEGLFSYSECTEMYLSEKLGYAGGKYSAAVEESGGVSLCEVSVAYELPAPKNAIAKSREALAEAMIRLLKNDKLGKVVEQAYLDTIPETES